MIKELLTIRSIAKKNKDYEVADLLKDFLEKTFLIEIQDTKSTSTYSFKPKGGLNEN